MPSVFFAVARFLLAFHGVGHLFLLLAFLPSNLDAKSTNAQQTHVRALLDSNIATDSILPMLVAAMMTCGVHNFVTAAFASSPSELARGLLVVIAWNGRHLIVYNQSPPPWVLPKTSAAAFYGVPMAMMAVYCLASMVVAWRLLSEAKRQQVTEQVKRS